MLLYAATIFLSAFLLFQVQPAIAKAILPWFGGTAAVWTACMLFFQTVLLLGYVYAHLLVSRVNAKWQGAVHAGLLGLSLALLPVVPDPGWKPSGGEEPALRILGLLAVTVGLPYFLLSTTSPLVQAWYARRRHAALPYRLFSVSNAASLLGLLAYPVLVEPFISTRGQLRVWSAAFAGFVVLCGAAALARGKGDGKPMWLPGASSGPDSTRFAMWVLLPACASALLLSVTNYLCQDVAPVPFLWILPLSVYLLSFILCFGSDKWYPARIFRWALAPSLAAMAFVFARSGGPPALTWTVPLFVAGLFVACVWCHGELVRLKPPPVHLTGFYLAVAFGGALGGAFVSLAAPALYSSYAELPVSLVVCAMLAVCLAHGGLSATHLRVTLAAIVAFAVLIGALGGLASPDTARLRNFYGALRIAEQETGAGRVRKLFSGSTLHGMQFISDGLEMRPTSYYGPASGIGLALQNRNTAPARVGLVGLGAGTLAAYARAGDYYRFYEINPHVTRIAWSDFSFLSRSAARIEVVLGDARISLEREPPQGFDVLAIDAFSSDSVPVHLLTREAFELYFHHLNPGGVLAVHLSNRYLDLAPVVAAICRLLKKEVRLVSSGSDEELGTSAAVWAVATADPDYFRAPEWAAAKDPPLPPPRLRLWTDDYSNLLQVVKR